MACSAITSAPTDQALTGEHAARILRAAAEGHVTLNLSAASWPTGRHAIATIESIGGGAMVVRISEAEASTLRGSIGPVDVRFSEQGRAYSCTTRVVGQSDDGDGIRLALPEAIVPRQRRRSRRYRLARGRVVEIRDPKGGGLLCSGTLLNLSPDGIAAKTAAPPADRCRSGHTCVVRFRLDENTPTFELSAGITNVTPGADPGQVVLGMEFLRGGPDETTRGRISDALSRLSPEATGGAV